MTRSGNCTTEGPTPVFKRFGGKGRAIDGRNIYFLFSNFFSKHEWHLCVLSRDSKKMTKCRGTWVRK